MKMENSIKQLLGIYNLNPHRDKKIIYKNKLISLMKQGRKVKKRNHTLIKLMKLVMMKEVPSNLLKIIIS